MKDNFLVTGQWHVCKGMDMCTEHMLAQAIIKLANIHCISRGIQIILRIRIHIYTHEIVLHYIYNISLQYMTLQYLI